MQRHEALGHIGKQVLVRSITHGTYIGELLSLDGSPWRGLVRVDGIIGPAVHFEQMSGVMRRGYRVGEVMEAAANSVKAWDAVPEESRRSMVIHQDYAQACEAEIERCVRWAADHWFSSSRPDHANTMGTLIGLRAAQFVEHRRLGLSASVAPLAPRASRVSGDGHPLEAGNSAADEFARNQQALKVMMAARAAVEAAGAAPDLDLDATHELDEGDQVQVAARRYTLPPLDNRALMALWPEALKVPAWSEEIEQSRRRLSGMAGKWMDWDLPTWRVAAQALEASAEVRMWRRDRIERIARLHAADAGYEMAGGGSLTVLQPQEAQALIDAWAKAKEGQYAPPQFLPPSEDVWSYQAWIKPAASLSPDVSEDLQWRQATFAVRFVEGTEVPAMVEGRTLSDGALMVTSWEITRQQIRAAKEAARARGFELSSADMDAYRLPSTPLRTNERPPGWTAYGMGRFSRPGR